MNKHIFNGAATALITPFSADTKDVEYTQFENLVINQINRGINALVVSGTTGEAPVLSKEEKINLIKIAVKASAGKVPIIAGTGSNNTEEAVRKSNDAEKEGVDGLLIVTPYYNKCSQEGIIKHYNYIAQRVSAPIIVYNVPSRTGVSINPETYKALSENKKIVAVKEASGNISEFNKSITLCGNDLDFYSGNDDQIIPMMSMGAKGVISVASNIIPEVIVKLCQHCSNNKYNEAMKINKKYLKLINSMFIDVNPIPVKAACKILFGYNSALRLPLTEINDFKYEILLNNLHNLNLI